MSTTDGRTTLPILQRLELAFGFVLTLWVVHGVGWLIPGGLLAYGIRPRHLAGLWGILFCPVLHANLPHLVANSGALFVLLALSLMFSARLTAFALAFTWAVGGLAVWLLGYAGAVYVGASGLIFGLLGFLMLSGVLQRSFRALVFGGITAMLYGGALLTLLRNDPGVSWLAHTGGFVAGLVAAAAARRGR